MNIFEICQRFKFNFQSFDVIAKNAYDAITPFDLCYLCRMSFYRQSVSTDLR